MEAVKGNQISRLATPLEQDYGLHIRRRGTRWQPNPVQQPTWPDRTGLIQLALDPLTAGACRHVQTHNSFLIVSS
jgi:hypothetical protein